MSLVLEQIAAGEIHMTGLLLLGRHLTEQNHQELLALARHRSKREILRLIRRIDPKPDAPASVEPLGPAPVGVPIPTANPSWEDFIEALSPRCASPERSSSPRQRRHVPAAVQRAVWSRDGSRCSYVDGRGVPCRETAFLELHHLHPDALGGPPTTENLTLRCRGHNALAAEQEFGRESMETKRRAGWKDAFTIAAVPL